MRIFSSFLKNAVPYQGLDDEEFDQLIIQQGIAAVVTIATLDMRGTAMMHAIMETLCQEYGHQVAFFYTASDPSKLPIVYGLYDTAAVFFFYNGLLVDHQIGLTSKKIFREKIEAFIASFSD